MRPIPVALILGLFLAPASASAQLSHSFEELARRVQTGKTVRVEDRSGMRTTGRLAALTADEIAVETTAGERRFTRDGVSSVAVRRSYASWGALLGAGVGAALCIPCTTGEHADKDAPVLTGLIGAGIGSITGALIPRMKTEYRAPEGPPALSVAPVFSRRGAGLQITLRW